jgi:hypothetical protein
MIHTLDRSWELARLPGRRSWQHTRGWGYELVYSLKKNTGGNHWGVTNIAKSHFCTWNFKI